MSIDELGNDSGRDEELEPSKWVGSGLRRQKKYRIIEDENR